MIALLASLALRTGVTVRFAKAAGIGAAVVLLIALLSLGKCAYDKSVITVHDTKVEAAASKEDRKADAVAAETRRDDDARTATEKTELERIATDAPATPVTNRRRTRLECIRLQQAARKDGRQPPACG